MRIRWPILWILYLIPFVCAERGLAQNHSFLQFSLEEGLPQSQVFSGIADQDGFLWFGTQGGGLVRFDGANFDRFTSSDGMCYSFINDLLEIDKRIWSLTSRGLSEYHNGRIQCFPFERHSVKLTCMVAYSESSIYLGSTKGLFEFDLETAKYKQLNKIQGSHNFNINALLLHDEVLWIGTTKGVYSYYGNTLRAFDAYQGLQESSIVDFCGDENGLWIQTFDQGAFRYVLGLDKINSYLYHGNMIGANSIYEEDNKLWIGTQNNGLIIYDLIETTQEIIDSQKGLNTNYITGVIRDSFSNKWILTSGSGVVKYLGESFSHQSEANGIPDKKIYALAEQGDSLWFSVGTQGLMYAKHGNLYRDSLLSELSEAKCKTIHTSDNELWVGTEGLGLFRRTKDTAYLYTTETGALSNWIKDIVQDSLGYLWVATHGTGIFQIESADTLLKKGYIIGETEGLPDLRIQDLAVSPNNYLWFGTSEGYLGNIVNGRVDKIYGRPEGLPGSAIRSVDFGPTGTLVVGTKGDGLYYSKEASEGIDFQKLKSIRPLKSENIYFVHFDHNRDLWVGSDRGMEYLKLSDEMEVVSQEYYGKSKGFLGIEVCQNSILSDRSGNLWVGTMNGLSCFSMRNSRKKLHKPKLKITGINVLYNPIEETKYFNGALTDLNGSLVLEPNDNDVGFEFKAVDVDSPNNLQYSWRLNQGNESSWSPFSTEGQIYFANLEFGEYEFQVKARSDWNKESATSSFTFNIETPLWEKQWFRLLSIALLVLISYLIWRARIRAIRKEERVKTKEVMLRNEVLELEQKAMQLQMNPHFIFNSLNSIQSLIATNKPADARKRLGDFAKLMRGILNNSRQHRIELSEELNMLKGYIEMEQFCSPDKFTYEIKLNNNVDEDAIAIPPMLIQPFVENSIQHGIRNLQGKPGELLINFRVKNNYLECSIIDNGIGLEKSKQLKNKASSVHESVAIKVTQKRLNSIMGKQNTRMTSIEEIKEGDTVMGTKVVILIPIDYKY